MADLDLDSFMRGLVRRNPGEREFHQAVREVVGSLIPFLRDHPNICGGWDPGTADRTGPHHHLPRLLARRRQQHPDEPRLPGAVQQRDRAVQRRTPVSSERDLVCPEVPWVRTDIQEQPDRSADGRRQGRVRLQPEGEERTPR